MFYSPLRVRKLTCPSTYSVPKQLPYDSNAFIIVMSTDRYALNPSETLWPLRPLRKRWDMLLAPTVFHRNATERLYQLTLTLLATLSVLFAVVSGQQVYFSLTENLDSVLIEYVDNLVFYGGLAVEFWLLWVLLTRYLMVMRSSFIILQAGMLSFFVLLMILSTFSEPAWSEIVAVLGIWCFACLRPAVSVKS